IWHVGAVVAFALLDDDGITGHAGFPHAVYAVGYAHAPHYWNRSTGHGRAGRRQGPAGRHAGHGDCTGERRDLRALAGGGREAARRDPRGRTGSRTVRRRSPAQDSPEVAKPLALVVEDRAAQAIQEAAAWWVANRPSAPDAFGRDLNRAFELIRRRPAIGARAVKT